MSSHSVVVVAGRLQTVRYVNVVCLTILATDYLLMFVSEYNLIWESKWSAIKTLYLLARYSAFVEMPLVMILYHTPNMPITRCASVNQAATWLTVFGIAIAEVILILRTYAVWGQNKKVLLFMGLFFSAIFFTNISILVVFLKYLQFGPLPSPTIPGCNTVKSSDILSVVWILLILHETVILVLTLYQGLKHLHYCRGRLWVTLFTDGIIYYLLFLVNMIANIIILFGLPVQYSDFLNPFQGVIHSVLSCRVILNLRAVGSRQDSSLGETSQSMQFAMQQRAGTTSSSSTSTVVQIANPRNIDEEHGVDDQT